MQGKKKIMAISMMGARPAVGIAGWDGANLFIMEINEQNCDPYIWMENMVRDLEEKAKKGWVTLIEDPTNSFPAPATAWSLTTLVRTGAQIFIPL